MLFLPSLSDLIKYCRVVKIVIPLSAKKKKRIERADIKLAYYFLLLLAFLLMLPNELSHQTEIKRGRWRLANSFFESS